MFAVESNLFPFFHKMTFFLGGGRRALSARRVFIKLAAIFDQAASVSENNNRKMKPSGMKIGEDAFFFFSRSTSGPTASSEPAPRQPNVNGEERKCVNNICSRVQIHAAGEI